MGVKYVMGTGTYLGLPSMVGRSKKATFGYIKDRIWKKINSWRGRALSKAGKDVMIKSILQAISSYVMSVYLIPNSVITDIEKMLNSFWWGGGSNNKGIRWLAWDRMARPKSDGGLGFRNLHAFNMAMIAKQAWKLVAEPEKLVARIFKARYFSRSSFFEAKIGANPSYVWRSIWRSRDVLENGCRWKIGDGSKIKIMTEPWLRGEDSLWVQSPQVQSMYDIYVKDLLLHEVKEWNIHKIHSIFSGTVAATIITTPLFEEVEEDNMVWQFEYHGKYTVKSGYKHYIKNKLGEHSNRVEGEWSSLWRIHAPPKTKHLLWRICRGCLPTRSRLKARYVPCPSECPICLNNDEDDWHILFGCCDSRQVWIEVGLHEILEPRLCNLNDVQSVLFDICRKEADDVTGLMAMVAWCIWQNRNNWVWNGEKDTAKTVALRAGQLIGEWRAVNMIQQQRTTNVSSRPATEVTTLQPHARREALLQWQRPSVGWLKCNVDASFSQHSTSTGWGWCVRNSNGIFVAAGTNNIMHKLSIVEGEARALLEAMKEAISRGWTNIVFESDSKIVVDAIQANSQGRAELSSIISSIKLLLQSNSNFEIKFIKRQANMVAHTLARAALFESSRTYFNIAPRCIEHFLINELS